MLSKTMLAQLVGVDTDGWPLKERSKLSLCLFFYVTVINHNNYKKLVRQHYNLTTFSCLMCVMCVCTCVIEMPFQNDRKLLPLLSCKVHNGDDVIQANSL